MTQLFLDKASPELIQDAFHRVSKKFPGKTSVVLWDGFGAIGDVPYIHCEDSPLSALDAYPLDTTVFIYACSQDDIGSPFVRRIIQLGGKFFPIRFHQPALFVHVDTVARRSLEKEFEFQKAGGFAKWDHGPHDFIGLIQALAITRNLVGDYVELGCYRGSSGGAVLRYLRDKKRSMTCHFLDVFEGFNYPVALGSADTLWSGTHATEGAEEVRRRLEGYAADTPGLLVKVYKSNCITDELPSNIEAIAVANVDVDLYEAVLAGLKRVAPLVVTGGIVVVEDPGHSPFLIGARVALDEFLEGEMGKMFIPIMMQSGQTFLIRR